MVDDVIDDVVRFTFIQQCFPASVASSLSNVEARGFFARFVDAVAEILIVLVIHLELVEICLTFRYCHEGTMDRITGGGFQNSFKDS